MKAPPPLDPAGPTPPAPAAQRGPGNLLRQWDGPLTRELLLAPGDFGLGKVPAGRKPDATTTAVCGYCSTGCGLNLHLRDGVAVGLTPDTSHPVNLGMACPKGWEALAVLGASDRATTPLLRQRRGVRLAPIDWPAALDAFCSRFKDIQSRHGKDAVAFLSTGQIVTEEMALLGAVAKFGMGMAHGDANTRQCMATAAVAYKQSFGFDAPPFTYADFEASDVLVLVGSNLTIAHPIMWERVLRNPHHPRIIVIDPRKTETALAATDHLALRPKSDLPLLYGLAHLLIAHGWTNREYIEAHTEGFDAFAAFVAEYTPEHVAGLTDIDEATLLRVASLIGQGQRVSFWWTMGINQSHEATRAAQAIINLALITGNIGRPGTGANSVTGQCNAMGSRLYSNTTGLFGGRDFPKPEHRAEVAGMLGLDPAVIPDRDSIAYHEILEGVAAGRIKGLWVIGTNTAHSWINSNDLAPVLEKLDFLVVQDMYASTETARLADLLLPAAGWGEKDGTLINSERRIGLVKKVARAPGVALTDFAIFKLLAEQWGCGDMFREWSSPEAVFQILKRLSRGRPCDITGVRDYRMLDACGGIQWPYSEADAAIGKPATERRLFEDGRFFTESGRAKLVFEAPRPMGEQVDEQHPLLLLTGRGTCAQWHTQTRTGKSAVLRKLHPQSVYVEINTADARRLGIQPGSEVRVASRRGELVARAFVTPTVQRGQVFIPMHYPETNRLTNPSFDPYSKQPSYKACAVRVEPAEERG